MADKPLPVPDTFNSMDYGHVIASPILAASDAQKTMSYITAEFIKKVGFDADGNLVNATFKHTKTDSQGQQYTESVEVPYISMLPIPNVMITEGQVILDVEVSDIAEVKEHIDAGGEGEGGLGWGPFSIKIKAKASYSKENTRKTDTRAKQNVTIKFSQQPLPEGISIMLEYLRNSSFQNVMPKINNAQPEAIPSPSEAFTE